jgi:hypothetical protein
MCCEFYLRICMYTKSLKTKEFLRKYRAFTPFQVFSITLFFGPIAGALTTGNDYIKRGKREGWIVAILPAILMYLSILFSLIIYPGQHFPLYLVEILIAYTYYKIQKRLLIEQHVYNPEKFQRALILGIIGTFLFTLPLVLLFGDTLQKELGLI